LKSKKDLLLPFWESKSKNLYLIFIISSVGSGKSSFFNSLLGEMICDTETEPSVEINGSISYVAQKPWIMNATIKENILLDNNLVEGNYNEALRTSCLQSDLNILINGDETQIGEKGVNLSGGQKARIALARAIYANSDIYLLDDPLSAVDAHVAKTILEQGLCGLLQDKTRVLVTHKLESLRYVDYIYIFKEGQVVAEGNFAEITQTPYYKDIERKGNVAEQETKESHSSQKNTENENETPSAKKKQSSIHEKEEVVDEIMLEEDRQNGAVTFAVWKSFFSYYGSLKYIALILFGNNLEI